MGPIISYIRDWLWQTYHIFFVCVIPLQSASNYFYAKCEDDLIRNLSDRGPFSGMLKICRLNCD